MTARNPINPYPTEPIVNKGELPDPFAMPDGARIATRDAWPKRSRAWRDMILEMEYGGLPPTPAAIEVETLYDRHPYGRRLRRAFSWEAPAV